MKKQYFGTDGIRGAVGKGAITPEFMLKLGWAAGRVFAKDGVGEVLIGKDTRISGYMFESALEAGLVSAGMDVRLLGPMPTPAVAYLTRTFHARAGIVISASHNAYVDNGIKFFSGLGEKLDDKVELAIEAELKNAGQHMEVVASNKIGKVSRINDAAGRYIEFCKSCFPSQQNLRGLKIVLDCAHGATYHVAPSVFTELGAEVIEIGVAPNGLNINDGVGSTDPEQLQKRVVEEQADFGIALDGDGDRVVMVDHLGEIVDGDVGTLMSNFGLELALQKIEVPFVRAAVGDRYVLAELRRNEWLVGGESSGHILCLDVTSTGDGTVSALQVVAAIVESGKSLHDLKNEMSKFPQCMINVRCDKEAVQNDSVQDAVKATERSLDGKGRVLLRPSGTEPVVRVMVEGEDAASVQTLAENLAAVVESAGS